MRIIARIIAVLLLVCSCYLFWAWHRSDLWNIGHDASWPHGFPYPDKAVFALERFRDQARPAPKGHIKLHGEFPRVQNAIGITALLCAAAGALCALPTLFHLMQRVSADRRGFPVTTNDLKIGGTK